MKDKTLIKQEQAADYKLLMKHFNYLKYTGVLKNQAAVKNNRALTGQNLYQLMFDPYMSTDLQTAIKKTLFENKYCPYTGRLFSNRDHPFGTKIKQPAKSLLGQQKDQAQTVYVLAVTVATDRINKLRYKSKLTKLGMKGKTIDQGVLVKQVLANLDTLAFIFNTLLSGSFPLLDDVTDKQAVANYFEKQVQALS